MLTYADLLQAMRNGVLQETIKRERDGQEKHITHRRAVCEKCDHYRDDVNTGKPMSKPCGLAPRLSACGWRKLLRMGEPPATDCPWHKLD